MIDAGQVAPAFTLKDSTGRAWSLDALRSKGPVVVFFYPRDESPICTREVCAFRDGYQDFVDAGATVVGVSSDSEEAHGAFAQRRRLPFLLLSDPAGSARAAFGIPRTFGLVDGRATFVIGSDGVVRLAFSAQFQAAGHMERALEAVRRLRSPAPGGTAPAAP
jgi:peroxiredoxin Q/BCP